MIRRRTAFTLAAWHVKENRYGEGMYWAAVAALPWWNRIVPPYLRSTPKETA